MLALLALSVVLVGNSYAAQRQVEIHRLQQALQHQQEAYAEQVAALTGSAAPARVALLAHTNHLVVPTSVAMIASVSLSTPLPLPKLQGYYVVQSRVYK